LSEKSWRESPGRFPGDSYSSTRRSNSKSQFVWSAQLKDGPRGKFGRLRLVHASGIASRGHAGKLKGIFSSVETSLVCEFVASGTEPEVRFGSLHSFYRMAEQVLNEAPNFAHLFFLGTPPPQFCSVLHLLNARGV
jgi:hypothetical protein